MESEITIKVPSKHTEAMIRAEIDSMLGFSPFRLCLGHVMLLAESKSPYIFGGEVSSEDIAAAQSVLGTDLPADAFHNAMIAELDAAFRALELFDDADEKDDGHKKSDVRPWTPEWLADSLRSACQAVPSIGLQEAIWSIPLTMMMHLGVAEARAQGSVTRRPADIKAALAAFKEMRKRKNG